jgi:hypothetical protein
MEALRIVMLLSVFLLAAPSAGAQQNPPGTDRFGDPLPKGAFQRLGTVRYWQDAYIAAFAFAANGKIYATVANTHQDPSVRLWNTATGKEILRCG